MEANQGQTENKRPSLIHGAFSFILPGSGQAIAGQLKFNSQRQDFLDRFI
jgi:hypothetical protein